MWIGRWLAACAGPAENVRDLERHGGRDVTAAQPGHAASRPTTSSMFRIHRRLGLPVPPWLWSLAETRMKILCLDAGRLIKPTRVPEQFPRLERARYWADFLHHPTARARDTDYTRNDAPLADEVANFNGVGGGTILFTAQLTSRMHQSDFRVRTATDRRWIGRLISWTPPNLFFSEPTRITGRRGLARSRLSAATTNMLPGPLGKTGTRTHGR